MVKKYLTVDELCDYLGLSKSTVYKLSHSNTLPKYCAGGKKILFKIEEVDEYINSHRIASASEIETSIEAEIQFGQQAFYNKAKKVKETLTETR
ncbi:helix-turn-helix transcriptional regulator [Pedobacter sp. SL55]|uniref:helix-turn-helix transcriptional regulator n=1 Tax=Pedobacter sp. SL55 TaxID=2995161 RepID=UPI00226FDF67|nr:helix-turn-helix domain-containing protein [Pedobacter sp. SL55]WAC39345.1 helix-turn-helix domain-containing protein [Pedobacter sp. SL55]